LKETKKALVTGGAGFIGSHLVDVLLKNRVRVTVLDNLSTGHRSNLEQALPKIYFIEGDIRHRATVEAAVDGCDVIFHQAAVVSVPQTVDDPVGSSSVNTSGTLTILDVARTQGVARVVLASSCAVYGDDPIQPKHEDIPPQPKSPYALQKLIGEMHARLYYELYGLESICLRYFNVYGPRQDPSSPYSGVISIFMDRAVEKSKPVVYGDGRQSRDFIYVEDVVGANLLAAASNSADGRAINVGTGHSITIKRLWEMISGFSNVNLSPDYEKTRPGDIQTSLADIRRARRDIGFEPAHNFKNGLESTFDWYNKHKKRA
jgi:nucleoside-diphosphate-sugar epimerase